MTKKIVVISLVLFFNIPIQSEFLTKPDSNVMVVGDKINVRIKPDSQSKVVYQLRLAENVKIIKKSGIRFQGKDIQGEWVLIDTEFTRPGETDSIKGWVVDYYLADYKKFQQAKTFTQCSISGIIGDWHMDYNFFKTGTYKTVRKDYETKKEKLTTGKIYIYRKVFILKDDDSDTYDYFYFTDDNQLCHYFRDREGKSICSKCNSNSNSN